MAKLHRRRRLLPTKAKRGPAGHKRHDTNAVVKTDLKERLGTATAGHEMLAKPVSSAAGQHEAVPPEHAEPGPALAETTSATSREPAEG